MPRHEPVIFPNDQYVIIAATTWSFDAPPTKDKVDESLVHCLTSAGIPADTAHALLDAHTWRAFDAVAAGSAYLMFQVMPFETPIAQCARRRQYDPALLRHGILLGTASMIGKNDVTDVLAVVGSEGIPGSIYGRVPAAVTEWFRSRIPAATPRRIPHQVRVYIPAAALAPGERGLPELTIGVWNDGVKEIGVPVAPAVTMRLWREMLPWHLERLRDAVGRTASTFPAVLMPNDSTLRIAVARYRRGEVIDAAQQAAAWRALDRAKYGGLDTARSSSLRHDRLIADVMVGGVLAAAGDTNAVPLLADDALGVSPCLVPSSPATGLYARTIASRRPNARCSSLPSATIARRGLRFPGGGHSAVGDKAQATVAATLVAATLGGAVAAHFVARQRYNDYQDATSVEDATRRYDDAVAMRNVSIGLLVGSAGLWLADMGYAVLREKRHASKVRAQQTYGR